MVVAAADSEAVVVLVSVHAAFLSIVSLLYAPCTASILHTHNLCMCQYDIHNFVQGYSHDVNMECSIVVNLQRASDRSSSHSNSLNKLLGPGGLVSALCCTTLHPAEREVSY